LSNVESWNLTLVNLRSARKATTGSPFAESVINNQQSAIRLRLSRADHQNCPFVSPAARRVDLPG
jgi:hypothetical protein